MIMKQTMTTNCELPWSMLEDFNESLNTVDLILFHLCEEYKEYKEYYKNLIKRSKNRVSILDNSAYEFFVKGQELDLDKYCDTINELNPTYYILPDELMGYYSTLDKIDNFLENYSGKICVNSQPMIVVQGNSSEELIKCYKEVFKRHPELKKNIAIPFHNSFFKTLPVDGIVIRTFEHMLKDKKILDSEDVRYAMGRVQWVLNHQYLLNNCDYIHILGSHCPLEKIFYEGTINSMDTGYPVKCGVCGYKLFDEPSKPDIIIDEFFKKPFDDNAKTIIKNNIIRFSKM